MWLRAHTSSSICPHGLMVKRSSSKGKILSSILNEGKIMHINSPCGLVVQHSPCKGKILGSIPNEDN